MPLLIRLASLTVVELVLAAPLTVTAALLLERRATRRRQQVTLTTSPRSWNPTRAAQLR